MQDLMPSIDVTREQVFEAVARAHAANASRLHFLTAVRFAAAWWRLSTSADATWARQKLSDELNRLISEGGRKDALSRDHVHRADLMGAVARIFGEALRPKALDWNETMKVVEVVRQKWPADRQQQFLSAVERIVFSFDRRDGPVPANDPFSGWPRAFLWARPQDVLEAAVQTAEAADKKPART